MKTDCYGKENLRAKSNKIIKIELREKNGVT